MKKLEISQMENLQGGRLTNVDWGCGLAGLAAGIAAGFNPLVGGLTAASCFELYSDEHDK